jgi:hypothetical protein
MERKQLHDLVKNLRGCDMIGAVHFTSFLCGSKPSNHLQSAVERLYAGDYDGNIEKSDGLDPWEADEHEARSHLRLLIDSLQAADLYTARRFLEYLADGSGPAVPTGPE